MCGSQRAMRWRLSEHLRATRLKGATPDREEMASEPGEDSGTGAAEDTARSPDDPGIHRMRPEGALRQRNNPNHPFQGITPPMDEDSHSAGRPSRQQIHTYRTSGVDGPAGDYLITSFYIF